MKIDPSAALLAAFCATSAFAQVAVPVGAVAANQTFAIRSGGSFAPATFDAYQGKIAVIVLMTPWCPICQSNTIAVGDGILDHFNSPARGALRGKNDAGIEIGTVMLSTEQAAVWDSTNAAFSVAQGFQQWGLDATGGRANPRVILGYLRGGFIANTDLHAWGADRTRILILNLVNGSSSHDYREVVLNQNSFTSADAPAARAAINAIQPPPTHISFSQWAAARSLPSQTSAAILDHDGDLTPNVLEYFHGTDPLKAADTGIGTSIEAGGGQRYLKYQQAKNIGGFTLEHLVSTDLVNWTVLSGLTPTVTDAGNVEHVSVPIPPSTAPAIFYRLRIKLN